jgi:hypothetical protein
MAVNWSNQNITGHSSTQAMGLSPSGFGISVLELPQDLAALESQLTMSIEMPTDHTSSQMDDMDSFSSEVNAPSGLSSSSYTQTWFDPTSSSQPALLPAKGNSLRRQSTQNRISASRGPIKKQKAKAGKFQQRQAITHLGKALRSDPTMSTYSKQKAAILLRQLTLLIEEEELGASSQLKFPSLQSSNWSNTSFTSGDIFSQDFLSNSGVVDSGYRTEDETSVSSTPRQTFYDEGEQTSIQFDPSQSQHTFRPIFECTKEGCHYSNYSQVDWRRHEKGGKHWPQERFMCLQCPAAAWDLNGNPLCSFCFATFPTSNDVQAHYLQCVSARNEGQTFGRKDHFCNHLRAEHRLEDTSQHAERWKYSINSDWPRQCGFCGIHFQSWELRMMHIAQHYQNGAKVKDWRLPFPPPRASEFRRRDGHRRRDDSDDEDDFEGNNGKRDSPTGQLRTHTKYTCQGNGLQSRQIIRSRTRSAVDSGCSARHVHQNTFGKSSPYTPSSLTLERYLNDTEERIPGIWKPESKILDRCSVSCLPELHPSSQPSKDDNLCLTSSDRSRNSCVALLHCSPGTRNTRLAEEYILKHKADLPDSILWVESKLTPEIKRSLWDIVRNFVLDNIHTNSRAARVLQNWCCRQQSLRRGSLPPIVILPCLERLCLTRLGSICKLPDEYSLELFFEMDTVKLSDDVYQLTDSLFKLHTGLGLSTSGISQTSQRYV